MFNYKYRVSLGLILVCQLANADNISSSGSLSTLPKQIVTLEVTGLFQNVYDSVISAILNRGLSIAHIDDAAKALRNSPLTSNSKDSIFNHAKIIAFCSTELSSQLIAENPNFIVLCPFTLSIFQTQRFNTKVSLSYRNPLSIDSRSKSLQKIDLLYQDIIEDATVWFSKPTP